MSTTTTTTAASRFKLGTLRRTHMYEDVQGHNQLAFLFFLAMSLLAHCVLAYVLFALFLALWLAGLRIANEKLFFKLSGLAVLITVVSLYFHGPFSH